jgi:Protein of unknown function (DUF2442)
MNVLNDIARSATYADGYIIVRMDSGVEIRFPVAKNPRLENGKDKELNNIKISPYGLHWPDLDEDLSFRGLLDGNYGQK